MLTLGESSEPPRILVVEFFLAVLLMLATAWLLGEGLHRVGQPALVGQLLAGVLVGPSLFNIVQSTPDLSTVENVGLFFIMLLTGLAVKPAKIIAAGKRGAIISSVAFVIPFLAGFWVARVLGVDFTSALTIALTISITAVPVNSIILMELGLIDTDLGLAVIAAGVIDDIISFITLGFIQQAGSGNLADGATVLWTVLKITAFLAAFFVCERALRKNIVRVRSWTGRLGLQLRTQGSFIMVILILAVVISLLAEWAGLQLVIGTFFAGLLLSELVSSERLEKAGEAIREVTLGFFGPLAFAFIGTEIVISSIGGALTLVAALLAVAIASKLVGGYVGARLAGFPSSESAVIGFLMNSRGFLELVIAATAFQTGLIDEQYFSIVVTIGIITTIIAPIAARSAIRRTRMEASAPSPDPQRPR